ncbi:ArnT family glycosyltransferase [Acetobacter sp. KSO5]|uniref:ArnT family glycosyltransferase n=1 Tax=Acetobacter sp. KSO5 TaxID=3373674 RepID=UPI00376F3047
MSYEPPLLAQNRGRLGSFLYRSFAIVLFGLILFPEFYHLGSQSIEPWDEARHIGSAYEMLFRHDYVVNYWQGKKDYWNLKPVLSFLPIILSVKLFGKGLMAARLPSLLGFVAIVLGLYQFAARKFSRVEGLYAITLFSIWSQALTAHSFRVVDADALYCTFYLFCILLCLKRTSLSFCLACVLAALCFLSKSWHALTLLPPLALTCVLTERSIRLPFKGMLCGLAPILLWVGVRIYEDGPKFPQRMVTYDLLKRTGIQIEGHHNPPSFYITSFVHDYPDLLWQLGFLTLAFGAACWWPRLRAARFRFGIPSALKAEMLILAVAVLSVFGMFTAAKTRLFWYTFPAYPILCVLMTYAFAQLRPALKTVAGGLAAVFFVMSFSTSWQRTKALELPTFYYQLQAAAWMPMTNVQKEGVIEQDDYAALLTYLPVPPTAIHIGPDESKPHTLVIRDKDAGACDGCALVSKGDRFDLFYRD